MKDSPKYVRLSFVGRPPPAVLVVPTVLVVSLFWCVLYIACILLSLPVHVGLRLARRQGFMVVDGNSWHYNVSTNGFRKPSRSASWFEA